MRSEKISAVIGATGAQYFLKNLPSDLTIRVITRNPSSASAAALKDLGVKADPNDKPSLERAFKRATYILSVTNYFDALDAVAEITQGVNVIDAACTTALHTLQSFIWSSLPGPPLSESSSRTSYTTTRKPRSQNTSARRRCGTSPLSTTTTAHSSSLSPSSPSHPIHITDVNALGLPVVHIISDPLHYHAVTILLSTQTVTPIEQVKVWADSLGVKAEFHPMALGDYVVYLREFHGFPEGLTREMGESFACLVDNPEMWTRRYGLDDHDPQYKHNAHVIKATEIMGKFKD